MAFAGLDAGSLWRDSNLLDTKAKIIEIIRSLEQQIGAEFGFRSRCFLFRHGGSVGGLECWFL
jgi:hypothetical protein